MRCVHALRQQTIAEQLEIIIVDNHSQDDSIGLLRNTFEAKEGIRIIENRKNLGYGQGNEAGIAHANGTYLLIINPDVSLPPDGLEQMVQAMEADDTIGILGPQLQFEDGTIRRSFRPFPHLFDILNKRTFLRVFFKKRLSTFLGEDKDVHRTQDVDWLAGGCILMRKDFYECIGGFDSRFFLFFEDTDLCKRIWKAGKRVVYFPKVIAHDGKKRLSEGGILAIFTKKTVRIHLLSGVKYFWKWRGS